MSPYRTPAPMPESAKEKQIMKPIARRFTAIATVLSIAAVLGEAVAVAYARFGVKSEYLVVPSLLIFVLTVVSFVYVVEFWE